MHVAGVGAEKTRDACVQSCPLEMSHYVECVCNGCALRRAMELARSASNCTTHGFARSTSVGKGCSHSSSLACDFPAMAISVEKKMVIHCSSLGYMCPSRSGRQVLDLSREMESITRQIALWQSTAVERTPVLSSPRSGKKLFPNGRRKPTSCCRKQSKKRRQRQLQTTPIRRPNQ